MQSLKSQKNEKKWEKWDMLMENYNKNPQVDISFYSYLQDVNKCPACKFRINGIIKSHPGTFSRIKFNEKFIIHYQQTHGVPCLDLVYLFLEKIILDKKLLKSYKKAYKFLDKF